MKSASGLKYAAIAFILLVAAGICVQQFLKWKQNPIESQTERLIMVNIISRHGDRGPTDSLSSVDAHSNQVELFWPNGLTNLTDSGRFRMFKLGLELRRMYAHYLGFDAREVLALTSPIYRCQESLNLTVRGLMNIEQAYDRQWRLDIPACSSLSSREGTEQREPRPCLSAGSGYADEWRKISLDTQLVPLSWDVLKSCKYRLEHPSKIEADMTQDPNITSLPQFDKLVSKLKQRYKLDKMDHRVETIYGTIRNEMQLGRSPSTQNYTDHFSDWVNEVVVNSTNQLVPPITMLDVLEQACILYNKDSVTGQALLVEVGPIVASLVDSQSVALASRTTNWTKHLGQQELVVTRKMMNYRNKKLILYSTHDDVLLKLLEHMGVMNFGVAHSHNHHHKHPHDAKKNVTKAPSAGDGLNFEARWRKWAIKSATGERRKLDRLLNGLDWPNYAMSLRFELFEVQSNSPEATASKAKDSNPPNQTKADSFAYVKLSIYNERDSKFAPIEYEPVHFGTICKQLFSRNYPNVHVDELFFKTKLYFDQKLGCPFGLFKNITSQLSISDDRLQQVCNPNPFPYYDPTISSGGSGGSSSTGGPFDFRPLRMRASSPTP